MSEYKDSLLETLNEYETNLPDKFRSEIDARSETLDKETNRSKYLFDILENALLVLDEKDLDTSELRLKKNMCDTLKHHIESGGAGREALTRLVALGILDEIPQIEITNEREWISIKKSAMSVDKDQKTIDLILYFNANVPDGDGNETWQESGDDGNICMAKVKLHLKDRLGIDAFLTKLHEDYADLMDVKYPDRD